MVTPVGPAYLRPQSSYRCEFVESHALQSLDLSKSLGDVYFAVDTGRSNAAEGTLWLRLVVLLSHSKPVSAVCACPSWTCSFSVGTHTTEYRVITFSFSRLATTCLWCL